MMPLVSQEAVGPPIDLYSGKMGRTVEILLPRGRRSCLTGKNLGTGRGWW